MIASETEAFFFSDIPGVYADEGGAGSLWESFPHSLPYNVQRKSDIHHR